jgi:hypothetical protein
MYYYYVEFEYVATSFSPARTDLAVKLLKLEKIYLLLLISLICAQRVNDDDVVAGDNACSCVWTLCGSSNAIGPSYGPIGIVLLLGFRGSGLESN